MQTISLFVAGLEIGLDGDQGLGVIIRHLLGGLGYSWQLLDIGEDNECELSAIQCRDHHQVSLLVGPVFVINIFEGVINVGSFSLGDVDVRDYLFDHFQEQVGGLLVVEKFKVLLGSRAKDGHCWILS